MEMLLAILNLVVFLYIIYLAIQHFGERKHIMWRGIIYAYVLYIIAFSYILNKDFGGIMLTGILYCLAIANLKKHEDSGA